MARTAKDFEEYYIVQTPYGSTIEVSIDGEVKRQQYEDGIREALVQRETTLQVLAMVKQQPEPSLIAKLDLAIQAAANDYERFGGQSILERRGVDTRNWQNSDDVRKRMKSRSKIDVPIFTDIERIQEQIQRDTEREKNKGKIVVPNKRG